MLFIQSMSGLIINFYRISWNGASTYLSPAAKVPARTRFAVATHFVYRTFWIVAVLTPSSQVIVANDDASFDSVAATFWTLKELFPINGGSCYKYTNLGPFAFDPLGQGLFVVFVLNVAGLRNFMVTFRIVMAYLLSFRTRFQITRFLAQQLAR